MNKGKNEGAEGRRIEENNWNKEMLHVQDSS